MIKNKNLMIKKLIEYTKEKDLQEKINKVKPYKLPDIEWVFDGFISWNLI